MKKMVVAVAAVIVAALLWSQPAEARCWWNGFRTVCTHRHYWGYNPYRYYRPYYYGSYGPYYYRPYVCTPWPLCWG
jgi:hypothetical protein